MNVITENHRGIPVIVDCNRLFLRTLGYRRAEVLGQRLADFYTPESRTKLMQGGGYDRALKGQFEAEERQLVARDGHVVQTLLRAMPWRDAGGQVSGTCSMYIDITVRKHAEQALRQSEAANRAFLEAIPDMIFRLSADGTYPDYKPGRGVRPYVPPQEFMGKKLSEVLPPEVARPMGQKIQQALQTGKTQAIEYVLSEEDGSHAYEGRLAPCGGEEVLVVVQDITERKRAEEKLSLYRQIFAHTNEAIGILDPQGFFLEQNAAHRALLGYPDDELCGKTPAVFLGRAVLSRILAELSRKGIYRGEVRAARRAGGELDIDLSLITIRNVEGNMLCHVALKRDITDRKRTEEFQSRLNAIIEATSDFVGVALPDGSIQYINQAGRKMCGLEKDADVTKLKLPNFHPEWVNRLFTEESFPVAIREGMWSGEAAFLHRDGTEIPMSMVLLAHKGKDGKVKYFSTISRDITERKRTEEEREQVEQALRDFVANVSHELKTPLAAIQGSVETLLDGGWKRAQSSREFLAIIQENSLRLTRLTDDLLKLSRIDAGKLELELRPVSVPELLEACVRTTRLKWGDKQPALSVTCPATLPVVQGDARRLREVLQNLLDNAVQYTLPGGRISLRAAVVDRQVVIAVSDTGIGIPAHGQRRIFERFYRVDSARSREVGGNGLGLAIAKSLVEAHGGRIDVESEVGLGATFSVFLPLGDGA
ncbi:PAS domain S-box protein [Acidobacteriia bacterium AH_259_A11_L15]|nr:PAS domain S-box protein [Acidobacteriia bacterium AH_259_A11_L15]